MSKINFFTPVSYQNNQNSSLENVDNYFYLGGKKAHVIAGLAKNGDEKIVLAKGKTSELAKVVKVISYFTVIIPLIMLIIKGVLRAQHSYKIIDPEKKLEKGMDIPAEVASKIQQLIPKIINKDEDEAIEWLESKNCVFKIKETPDLVYKIASGKPRVTDNNKINDKRFENMVIAKRTCLVNGLGLLVIPQAKKFDIVESGISYTVIAEKRVDIEPEEYIQEELFRKHSKEMNETVRELSILIAKAGLHDVAWRNIPLINEAPDFQGSRRIALIDLEAMNNAKEGFLGGLFDGSAGLIRLVSKEQVDIVIKEAKNQRVKLPKKDVLSAKNNRLQELDEDEQLRLFHAEAGIETGRELLEIDLESLGLDLNEEGINKDIHSGKESLPVTLKEVAETVIAQINASIEKNPGNSSAKRRRNFELSTYDGPLEKFSFVGMEPQDRFSITEDEKKKIWLNRILEALVEKKHIFKASSNGFNYSIQA